MQGVAWENEGGRWSADPRTLVYLVKSGSCLTSRDPKLEANCRFSGGSEDKASACNAGDPCSVFGREDPLEMDRLLTPVFLGFLGCSDSEESAYIVGDLGSIPRLGRSPGRGHGNPL